MPRYVTPTTLRIPPEQRADLQAAAKAAKRSLCAEILFRLEQYEQQQQHHQQQSPQRM